MIFSLIGVYVFLSMKLVSIYQRPALTALSGYMSKRFANHILRECLNLTPIKHYKHNKPSIRVFVEEK